MEAKNFNGPELSRLVALAHEKKVAVYVAINSLIKASEVNDAAQLIWQLMGRNQPDALIVQDLAMIDIVKSVGYTGEIHLSTLANVTFPAALQIAASINGVRRVVLPRELSIDEIKMMAQACPPNVTLEAFIHGALCYAVSGRCYWSSYMGGKSGLRGRCVQPCRRVYRQEKVKQRYYSCQDLSLDTLIKVLKEVPQIKTWKIEGRKKSPHYVYYTVQAYRMLRDEWGDPSAKKAALALLEMALGRKGTHYNFLPQRPRNPLEQGRDTGSGFQLGTMKGSPSRPFFSPRIGILVGDTLRIGYEDQPWHTIVRIKKSIPRNGQFYVNTGKGKAPRKGTPVFLTDRREPALSEYISSLAAALNDVELPSDRPFHVSVSKAPAPINKRGGKTAALCVFRSLPKKLPAQTNGMWLSEKNLKFIENKTFQNLWVWLPPVIWPDREAIVCSQVKKASACGITHFVLNAPWQTAFFENAKSMTLWAGPFCNIANPGAIVVLKQMGFNGVFISPELGRDDVLLMPEFSALPLGIVVGGNWPLCISRIAPETLIPDAPFQSPKGEMAWLSRYEDGNWVFPNWSIDLSAEIAGLQKAGYRMLVTLREPVPAQVPMKDRPGLWNWTHDLM